jgi:hypothetical protein
MEAESFFSRWSRRKAETRQETAPAPAATPVPAPAEEAPPPTLEDAQRLTPDADFAPFLACGVDEAVKRTALKKLFSDPRFNVMDGLDVYIDDYNKFEPIPPAMLGALEHAKNLLNPKSVPENTPLQMIEPEPQQEEQPQEETREDTLAATEPQPAPAPEPAAGDAPAPAPAPEPPHHDDPL